MQSYSAPPPIYSPGRPQNLLQDIDEMIFDPQIFIVPAADTLTFQKGFLGAEGERAAIEGEIHIKGAQPGQWKNITVALCAVESAFGEEIELGSSEINLVSLTGTSDSMASSMSFAIPLTSDAPQCIHTPHSSLEYTLTATFHPLNPIDPVVSRKAVVHTRRYTSHSHAVDTLPETHVLASPSRVEVQVPRSVFRAGEPIPVYITVPSPSRQLMLSEGLRLRNVKAEIIRVVSIKRGQDHGGHLDSSATYGETMTDLPPQDGPSSVASVPSREKPLIASGSIYSTVISRSGASCRFHSSRPVRLRCILHQVSPSASPVDYQRSLPDGDYSGLDDDSQCISITQTTLLHSVSFFLNVYISFVDTTNRTERVMKVSIPLTIIPPPAPLPEVEEWVDAAYQKKHDRPPLRTVRQEDPESSIPIYHEGEAGPSYSQNGAPPPFEDRDMPPPPFFSSESSTSNVLPSFQESESEIYIPSNSADEETPLAEPSIIGEGILFGFTASEQFDGHSDTIHCSSTPPPPVEMAQRDTDVTGFADIGQPVFEALNLDDCTPRSELPPPPPAMDDPSDPPPSIDSDFRLPAARVPAQTHSPPLAHQSYNQTSLDALHPPRDILHHSSHGHAPPPYLVPDNDPEQEEHVARPPPYTDLIPHSSYPTS